MTFLLRASLSILLAAYALTATAQNSPPRGGKWEFTLQPQYTHSMSFDSGNGSSGTVDSALGFGFGVGYNLNNHLTLGGDFFWNSGNYAATIAPAAGNTLLPTTLTGVLETSTFRFNATWNFLASDFTPFVTAGIGSTYVDTNIPYPTSAPVCWYDPWWGYYCSQPTRSAYYVSYSGGAGVRWDLDRNVFLRGLVIRQWIDASSSLGSVYTDQYRFDVGFKF